MCCICCGFAQPLTASNPVPQACPTRPDPLYGDPAHQPTEDCLIEQEVFFGATAILWTAGVFLMMVELMCSYYMFCFGFRTYIYIYIPGKPYCHFFWSKRIFPFFWSITGFCQIRYFSNIRVRFFFNNMLKKYGFITG